ncbi:hypothetical protein [Allohahella sp. A8]|uniref:hypothetical protein n=1 Tax=Allohahella sp. A8 TaxID=3141461 RepID=UPI003A7FA10A
MTSIQAGYSAQAANLNLTSNSSQNSPVDMGNWLARTGGGMAADAINALPIDAGKKREAIAALMAQCMPPEATPPGCGGPVMPEPGCRIELPCCGTPAQEGEAMRQLDDLKEAFNKFFQEVMTLLGKGGSENSESARNSRATGAASNGADAAGGAGGAGGAEGSQSHEGIDPGADFFTALAHAIGETLQRQADTVKTLSDKMMTTSAAEGNGGAAGSTAPTDGAAGSPTPADGTAYPTAQTAQATNSSTAGESVDPKNLQTSDDLMKVQTQLTAETMKMQFLSTGLQTALKSVSDSLNTMARG